MQIETVNPTRLANVIKSFRPEGDLIFHWHPQTLAPHPYAQADVASLSSSRDIRCQAVSRP